jgi:hypothetical protein
LRLRVDPEREREPPEEERLLDRLLDPEERDEVERRELVEERPTDQVLRDRVRGLEPPQSYDWLPPPPPVRMLKTSSQSKPPPPYDLGAIGAGTRRPDTSIIRGCGWVPRRSFSASAAQTRTVWVPAGVVIWAVSVALGWVGSKKQT